MGAGIQPTPLSDADLYEWLRDQGLSHAKAVLHIERRRNAQQPVQPTGPTEPTAAEAALVGGAQGATSGLADEIVGRMMAIRDPNVPLTSAAMDSSVADLRQRFANARDLHPVASIAGNIGGSMVNPLNRILGPATKGLGPTATGATYGSVLGGMQGLGEGDEGDRGLSALVGTIIGFGTGLTGGYAIGKVAKPLGTIWTNLRKAFGATEREVTQALGRGATAETVRDVQEAAHVAYLQKNGFADRDIATIMETWRAGGRLPNRAPPTPSGPPAVRRPGETLTQVAPREFEVTGNRPTPPVPTTPTISEMLGITSRGKTLPYYPRGGRAEQAIAPFPMTSPPVQGQVSVAGQQQVFADFLRGVTPAELPGRLDAMRALGVQLPAGAEAELAALLGAKIR